MSTDRALTYTPRERKFVMWSAILGYAFDFYNLIVVAFLLGRSRSLSTLRCRKPG